MYLVIFSCWVGPVPYLELFGAGPVKKNNDKDKDKDNDKDKYIYRTPSKSDPRDL